jgi:hypothetical protein
MAASALSSRAELGPLGPAGCWPDVGTVGTPNPGEVIQVKSLRPKKPTAVQSRGPPNHDPKNWKLELAKMTQLRPLTHPSSLRLTI